MNADDEPPFIITGDRDIDDRLCDQLALLLVETRNERRVAMLEFERTIIERQQSELSKLRQQIQKLQDDVAPLRAERGGVVSLRARRKERDDAA